MSKENYFHKIKELPEIIKQFGGLVFMMIIVILSFAILNSIFGEGDELVAKMKIEEERIAQARKLDKLISSLPSGILVSFDGTDHFRLTDEVYEKVCNATKLIPQRAIMGANFLNFRAHELYTINGNKINGEAEGLHARVIQHEYDHLNGILYTSRLADKRAFGYSEEIEKFWKKNDEETSK